MKKSEHFHNAQLAVMSDGRMTQEEKLAIIRTLMESEDLEKYREKDTEEEA